ncbi:MAG: hypothetical protein NW223_21530 [Hyphomicrobiaceae bacterium]|nr:hypothetical protein [Hyphomicrobiaceae bacterium]
MLKVALVVWIMLGTVLAGAVMTAIVSVPSLSDQASMLIPIGCIGAYVVGLPIAYIIARRIADASARPA